MDEILLKGDFQAGFVSSDVKEYAWHCLSVQACSTQGHGATPIPLTLIRMRTAMLCHSQCSCARTHIHDALLTMHSLVCLRACVCRQAAERGREEEEDRGKARSDHLLHCAELHGVWAWELECLMRGISDMPNV